LEVVEEHLGGVVVDHRLDRPDLDTLPEVLAQIDKKHRKPIGAPLDLADRGGPRQQQHQVGVPGARSPHLLARLACRSADAKTGCRATVP